VLTHMSERRREEQKPNRFSLKQRSDDETNGWFSRTAHRDMNVPKQKVSVKVFRLPHEFIQVGPRIPSWISL